MSYGVNPPVVACDAGRPVPVADRNFQSNFTRSGEVSRCAWWLAGLLCLLSAATGAAQIGSIPPTRIGSENAARTGSGNGGSSTSGRIQTPQRLISDDGRFAVFQSTATDLVALPDLNGANNTFGQDIFLRDFQSRLTELISVNQAGMASGNSYSRNPTVSADGRYVCFISNASDLVADDANGLEDVFVRDRQTGITSLVSVSTAGGSGNLASSLARMTPDGHFVAFLSRAANLVSGVFKNTDAPEVYVRDLQAAETRLASIDFTGQAATGAAEIGEPSISDDGRFVAFESLSRYLVQGDNNADVDVFLRDLTKSETELISIDSQNAAFGNSSSYLPVLSGDARYVAFISGASNLVQNVEDTNGRGDLFVRDRLMKVTRLVTINAAGTAAGNGLLIDAGPAFTHDGRHVAFTSLATDLVTGINDAAGTGDVFARDLQTGATALVSVDRTGNAAGNGSSGGRVVISDDGMRVAFVSAASNLVEVDTNSARGDLFQRDLAAGITYLVSRNAAGTGSGNDSSGSSVVNMTPDGATVYFDSSASDLVSMDTNGHAPDVFVWASTAVPFLTLANCAVSPSGLPPSGGAVTISLDVTSDEAITSVVATITQPEGTTVDITLTPAIGDTFRGSFTAPTNTTASPQSYGVSVTAITASGDQGTATCDPFSVASGDAAPPVLEHCGLRPRSVLRGGGRVNVSVTAVDNIGVAGVTAIFTLNETATTLPLTRIVSGLYAGTFTVPANTSDSAQSYAVIIQATDAAGNSATADCGSFQVLKSKLSGSRLKQKQAKDKRVLRAHQRGESRDLQIQQALEREQNSAGLTPEELLEKQSAERRKLSGHQRLELLDLKRQQRLEKSQNRRA